MVCKVVLIGFIAIYLIALAILVIGTFGLFGQQPDPLSGVFVMPLGLPWNRLAFFAPDAFLPWVAVLAPLVNIGLIAAICRWRVAGG